MCVCGGGVAVVGASSQSFDVIHIDIEGWSFTLESLEGHRLICILAQRRPPGDPELRWDRVERLAAFRRSSPPVQGERESSAALIGSAGGKNKRGENRSKNTGETETNETGKWRRWKKITVP